MNSSPPVNDAPYLSVVIPTYNRCQSLAATLQSLCHQRDIDARHFEIIVVDDGSTDDTQRTTLEVAAGSSVSISYFCQPNRGPAASRNVGIRQARGKVILFIGDDIVGHSHFLQQHREWHQKIFPQADAAILGYSPMVGIDGKRGLIHQWLDRKQMAFQNLRHGGEASYHYFYTCNISIKKSFLMQHGLFKEEYPLAAGEDTELGFRLAGCGLKIYYNHEALAYHVHPFRLKDLCRRYYNLGRASTTAKKLGYSEFGSWASSRNKLSPFRNADIVKLLIYLQLFVLCSGCFALGRWTDPK